MNREKEKRNIEIYECRKRGETFDTIAKKYGISRERVRQIVLKQECHCLWVERKKQ